MTAIKKNNAKVFGSGGKALIFAHGYGCDQKEPARFDKLVLIGPSPRYINDINYIGWASSMARVITFLSDNRADLPKLKTQTLILQCSQDVIVPEVVGQYLHQNLANSRLRVLEATGHCPHLSAPEETIAAMRTFL